MEYNTYFYDEEHQTFASLPGIIPIAQGVLVNVRDGTYIVESVELHLNNKDPHNGSKLGFRVFCKKQ